MIFTVVLLLVVVDRSEVVSAPLRVLAPVLPQCSWLHVGGHRQGKVILSIADL